MNSIILLSLCYCSRFEKLLLSSEVASRGALKAYDGVGDLQVSFFFQMSQDSSSEKDFALTHAEQVEIQFQSSDLNEEKGGLEILIIQLTCGMT